MEDNNKQMEDLASSMKLVVTNTEETNYSDNYHDVNVTVKNISSSTVSYAKVELYFKDEKGNMCNWLCANGTLDDFQNFAHIFDLIEQVL